MIGLVSLTAAVGIVLVFLGIREGALDFRPQPRRCPHCGRQLRSWACRSCTDSRGA